MPSAAASATSAATRASSAVAPSPNSPRPGTSTTRGRGSCIAAPLARLSGARSRPRIIDEGTRRLPHGILREIVELSGFRRRHDERPGFSSDDMIGRDRPGTGVARHVFAVDVIQYHIAAAKLQDQPLMRALTEGIAQRTSTAGEAPRLKLPRSGPATLRSRISRCPFCTGDLPQA